MKKIILGCVVLIFFFACKKEETTTSLSTNFETLILGSWNPYEMTYIEKQDWSIGTIEFPEYSIDRNATRTTFPDSIIYLDPDGGSTTVYFNPPLIEFLNNGMLLIHDSIPPNQETYTISGSKIIGIEPTFFETSIIQLTEEELFLEFKVDTTLFQPGSVLMDENGVYHTGILKSEWLLKTEIKYNKTTTINNNVLEKKKKRSFYRNIKTKVFSTQKYHTQKNNLN